MKVHTHTKTNQEVMPGFPSPFWPMLDLNMCVWIMPSAMQTLFHQCVLFIAYFIALHIHPGCICIITVPTKLLSGKYVQTTFILQE